MSQDYGNIWEASLVNFSIQVIRIFSFMLQEGEVKLEISAITLKNAMDAERLSSPESHTVDILVWPYSKKIPMKYTKWLKGIIQWYKKKLFRNNNIIWLLKIYKSNKMIPFYNKAPVTAFGRWNWWSDRSLTYATVWSWPRNVQLNHSFYCKQPVLTISLNSKQKWLTEDLCLQSL